MTKEQLKEALMKVIVEFRNETGFDVEEIYVKYQSDARGNNYTRQILDIEVHVE